MTALNSDSVVGACHSSKAILEACRRVPPLWTLKNFVAVNPFLGLTDRHIVAAAHLLERTGHGTLFRSGVEFLKEYESRPVTLDEFERAKSVLAPAWPVELRKRVEHLEHSDWLRAMSAGSNPHQGHRLFTVAECVDLAQGTRWAEFVVDELSKWCSSYFDQGQSSWPMPLGEDGLYAAWMSVARLDRNPEMAGLAGFRSFVSALPETQQKMMDAALEELGVPDSARVDFLHRELMSISGWSGFAQFVDRQSGCTQELSTNLAGLLAIRMAYDCALFREFSKQGPFIDRWHGQAWVSEAVDIPVSLVALEIAQEIAESRYRSELIQGLSRTPVCTPRTGETKGLQAVFCIDVRSEVYRRCLESVDPGIETVGFAGFFGMPIAVARADGTSTDALCPVLFSPKYTVSEVICSRVGKVMGLRKEEVALEQGREDFFNRFKTSAVSCFPFVETMGLGFGMELAKEALKSKPALEKHAGTALDFLSPPATPVEGIANVGIPISDQILLAESALRNMGLTEDFAPVVLLCGHGSTTRNNPYGSGLDCGACGGHSGDVNARVAAAMLNQYEVRTGLALRGIHIPTSTFFVAGMHNTTTDEVTLFVEDLPVDWDPSKLSVVREWTALASKRARVQRASRLGLESGDSLELSRSIFGRSRDWAEVRPEWGLAGNAAFVAAPRYRTKGLDLAGRVFLHNYDSSRDSKNALLELILIAPMVVASWINLQYYGSTVNNRLFGSGNKLLHNVVGTFGVWEGNAGDLQSGLPLQSLHDGEKWVHEPLRLSVFIEAKREAIEQVFQTHAQVRHLVENGWVRLLQIEPGDPAIWLYTGGGTWHREDSVNARATASMP